MEGKKGKKGLVTYDVNGRKKRKKRDFSPNNHPRKEKYDESKQTKTLKNKV